MFKAKVRLLLVIVVLDCFFQISAKGRDMLVPRRPRPRIPTRVPQPIPTETFEPVEQQSSQHISTPISLSSDSLAPDCSQVLWLSPNVDQPLIVNFYNQTCRSRCKGNIGYNHPKDYIAHNLCSCEEGCKAYGDCCFDFESECQMTASSSKAQVQYMGCIAVQWRPRDLYEPRKLLGINKCPSEYDDDLTKRLCEEDIGWKYKNQTTFTASIAVVRGGVIYRNIFCAVCSGAESKSKAFEESIFEEVKVLCAEKEIDEMTLQSFSDKCFLIPHESDNVERRICNTTATASLFSHLHNCMDNEANQLCFSFASPVLLSDGQILPNAFCHQCLLNHSDTEISQCLNGEKVIITPGPPRETYSPVDLPSFAMLMDFVGGLNNVDPHKWTIPGLGRIHCSANGAWSDEIGAKIFPSLCHSGQSDDDCCWTLNEFGERIQQLDSIFWKYELVIASERLKLQDPYIIHQMPCYRRIETYFENINASTCPSNDPLKRTKEGFDNCWMASFNARYDRDIRVTAEKAIRRCVSIGDEERLSWWLTAFSASYLTGNWSHQTLLRSGNLEKDAEFILRKSDTHMILELPLVVHYEVEKAREYVLKGEIELECDSLAIWESDDLDSALTINTSLSYFQLSHDTALVCLKHQQHETSGQNIEGLVTLVCQVLSMSSLLVTLVVYFLLPSLRNPAGCCLICLSLSLLVAQALLQFGWLAHHKPWLCIAVAATTHCAWLMAFSWMVILAFDISSLITRHSAYKQQSRFRRYLALAVTGPVVFVVLCLVVGTTRPDLLQYTDDDGICWISSSLLPRLLLFSVPVTCALVANAVFFTRTLLAIREAKKAADRSDLASQTRCSLIIYVRLASLMGFTWIFGLLQNAIPSAGFMRYSFIICNALQGVNIMLSLVFKRRVYHLLRERFKKSQPEK